MDVKTNLINSKIARKSKYDSSINPITYIAGDLILVKNENCKKLNPLYLGPFSVVKDISLNVVILVKGKEKSVHKNRTRIYYE